jgi:hypothetical protein
MRGRRSAAHLPMNMKSHFPSGLASLLLLGAVPCAALAVDGASKPGGETVVRDIGSRWELFVDEFLVANKS